MILAALALALCPVASVTDGDTIRLCSGERVRLASIDAPELRSRCPAERRLAVRARNRLAELLSQGEVRMHRSGRNRDRYARLLRVVTVNGRDVGDVLVRERLARAWTGRRLPWC